MTDDVPPAPPGVERDLALSFEALAAAGSAAVLDALDAAGFGDLRPSHGYVFQHLVPGPTSIGELADALGITPQGASKAVVELEAMGYVVRSSSPHDARRRDVALTDQGTAAVDVARQARAAWSAGIADALGPRRAAAFTKALRVASDHTGALDRLFARRLRPPG